MPDERPTWPLALSTTVVAGLVALPALSGSPSWLDRLALGITGRPLEPQHAVVLSIALLLAARGLLLRRRIAWYGLLAVIALGMLAAASGADPLWRLPLLGAAAGALWQFRGGLLVSPHPARVRTAVRTGAAIVFVSLLGCVIIGDASVRSVGRDVFTGLGGAGLEDGALSLGGPPWLPAALALLGGIGLIAILEILMAPAPPPPPGDDFERRQISALVCHPESDTLAPFALRHDKSYVFSPDRRAAIGYRVLFGVAAAGGDPVGDPRSYGAAIKEFLTLCGRMGWRPAVLGASAGHLPAWAGLRSIGFGDEVIIQLADFSLSGRQMRNVRQAVQRTHRAGVKTEVMAEGALSPELRDALLEVASASLDGAAERGFSMNLDSMLTGRHPGCVVAVAYDEEARPIAFQRYASAGRALSLDAMRRIPDAPNGINERLIVEMLEYAREQEVPELSLNFAAFRELLDAADRGPLEQIGYRALHLLDPLIAVESLYLFDRKFRPSYRPRSVIFRSWADIGWVAAALLTLEFGRSRPAAPVAQPEPLPELSSERR
ncbi:bifunctional lysylphosphatidylglycerol flippase/synthetase MprF [Actinomadura scrupuli]|uniref:bifunctional lysylphosphatidylglycerol flippase/synthetase MprF n=1 Tax=Actinomadura scrupuli TaxID=559629 RepID=UPI003D978A01